MATTYTLCRINGKKQVEKLGETQSWSEAERRFLSLKAKIKKGHVIAISESTTGRFLKRWPKS